MRVDVVTIFPDYLAPLELSLIGKARDAGLLDVAVHDLRQWTADPHRTVDDTPYGGGAGMVMKAEPWAAAIAHVLARRGAGRALALSPAAPSPAAPSPAAPSPAAPSPAAPSPAAPSLAAPSPAAPSPAAPSLAAPSPAAPSPAGLPHGADSARLVLPSPAGRPFTQAVAQELAALPWLIFACGRYEGIDQRFIEAAAELLPVDEISLGDYVLGGGEVAVLAMVEAVGRLLPGVVGNARSLVEESHADGLLEYPVYTKPARWRDRPVPEVLLSGHHAAIARWRRDESLRRTAARRPDLLRRLSADRLDARDLALLRELGWATGPDGRLVGSRTAVAD
jgi:tRNA (guanine-N1)-methyltransferase